MPDSQHGDHPGSSGVWQEEECHRYGFLFRRRESAQSVADNDFAAVARCVQGKGLIRVNGKPLKLFAPEILRAKLYEPVLLLGTDKFAEVDIRVRVTGGGHTSQVYAVRQAVRYSGLGKGEPSARGFGNADMLTRAVATDCQGHCQFPAEPVAARCAARRKTEVLTPGISRLPTTPSTSTSTPRTSSRRSSSSSTAACWSPTPGVASPRSLAERVPVRGSRSPTVDRSFGHVGKRGLAWTRTAFGIALISYESRLASNDGLLRCTLMAPWEIGIRLESTWPPLRYSWQGCAWIM